MRLRWRIYILIALLLAVASCGLFENKKDPEFSSGRRDYTWTVDTLTNRPNGFIMGIWGASPNDVWAAGYIPFGIIMDRHGHPGIRG